MDVAEAYEFLKLDEYASVEDVSASFRRLLKEYHPDRNGDRGEWSHRMTVRLTEAYAAVTAHLRTEPAAPITEPDQPPPDERDAGYSVTMQLRIAELYDVLLDQVFAYYNHGMHNIYLRQEGTMRYRFRSTVRQTAELIDALRETQEWPGSSLQYRQLTAIHDFTAAFYENMLIKPKDHQIYSGEEQKAVRLYQQGSDALDRAIREGLLESRIESGRVSPGGRSAAERAFLLVLANFPASVYVPETLIKMYLFRSFSALCEFLEAAAS
ncbi:MAG TPA: J domain-containing protein [Tichowtungia sp.]|nr:J domain-containing protein [Tichowtungia sp.]